MPFEPLCLGYCGKTAATNSRITTDHHRSTSLRYTPEHKDCQDVFSAAFGVKATNLFYLVIVCVYGPAHIGAATDCVELGHNRGGVVTAVRTRDGFNSFEPQDADGSAVGPEWPFGGMLCD